MDRLTSLKKSYEEATANNGLIALVTEMQEALAAQRQGMGRATIATQRVASVIERSGSLWESTGQATGHKPFRHKVTDVVIGYEGHGPKEIYGHHLEVLCANLQQHLNILCNDVFAYQTRNWKTEPDYVASVNRYNNLARGRRDA